MDNPITESLIADEHRIRSFIFWNSREVKIAWPIAPKGYTFLGNAVHIVGATIFHEWTGNEPADFQRPILCGSLEASSDRERVYACALLAWSDDEAVSPIQPDELTDAQWSQAVMLYYERQWPFRRMATHRMGAVMRSIIEGAAQGQLIMATRLADGRVMTSPPNEWATEWAYPRFSECQMNPFAPFFNASPQSLRGSKGARIEVTPISGNQWIFVETVALAAFLAALEPVEAQDDRDADRSPKMEVPEREAQEWQANFTAPPKRSRQSPQRARALKVIQEMFPSGVPDTTELTDGQLGKMVADKFNANVPSLDTILRAAGRKQ